MQTKVYSWLYNTQTTGDHLKVACVTISIDQDPAKNMENLIKQVDAILLTHPDIELVVFGEMLLGWFIPAKSPEYHQRIARPLLINFLQPLIDQCRQYGIYLCFGMPELDGEERYNAQVLINPLGNIQAVHRKWNLKHHEVMAGYCPGCVPVTVTNIKNLRTGILICADAAHPKTMWQLIKNRLDLIILSLADDCDEDFFLAKFNARMYDAWVVTANRYGDEDGHFWDGHTVISDPTGSLRAASKDKEGYLLLDINFDRNQNILKFLLRNFIVKASLLFHLLTNLKRIKDYM